MGTFRSAVFNVRFEVFTAVPSSGMLYRVALVRTEFRKNAAPPSSR
jgi:hypothetical protein